MAVSKPSPKPRDTAGARSRAATRERLIESGRSLFAEHGLRGVTTHDIARQAGVAAGTFYLHFSDKRDLFRKLIGESVAVLRERLDKAVAGATDLTTLVRGHATALVGLRRGSPRPGPDPLQPRPRRRRRERRRARRARFDRRRQPQAATAVGETPSPDSTLPCSSQALVGMWARVVAWWAEDPTRAPREAVIETLSRIQLEGTQPGPGN